VKNRHIIALLLIAGPMLAAGDEQAIVARVIDSSSDRVPQLTVAPKYPRKARRDRVEGEVQVCFEIDRKGRTHRIAVRNSTNRIFEKPSINAVRASSFRPVDSAADLSPIKFCRTFVFSLEPQADVDVNPVEGE
jgi:TonB family protein